MHDPMTLIYGCKLFDIWHVDPCKDGSDDSCGWFMRSRHGDKEVLNKIQSDFEFDWDRVYESEGPSKTVYHQGYFCPNGDPNLSTHGIVINLFWIAALKHFKKYEKAQKFMRKHLFDILFFAENPVDSLSDGITRKFEIGCGEKHTAYRRKERIEKMASCIYAWILRADRPWYRHPKFHFWHWKINIHPYKRFLRWAFTRCMKCGKRVGWTGNVVSHQWESDGPQWFKSETVEGPCCNGH